MLSKIDIHVHICRRKGYAYAPGGSVCTPEELIEMYDALNIEKGVLLPMISPECALQTTSNEDVCEIVSKYPDRFSWFCNLDPRTGENSADTDFSSYIEYYKKLGAKGIGEVTANLSFDDPLVRNLFRHAEKTGMPVLFHIGDAGGGDYGLVDTLGLPGLERALVDFPGLTFLGHSVKFWSEISGDCTNETRSTYPKGKVTPGGRVVELMRKYPNLHGDLSAGSGVNAILRDTEFGYAFLEEFSDKLYFGTDICDPSNINDIRVKMGNFLDDAVQNGKISGDTYKKISRDNALALLKE